MNNKEAIAGRLRDSGRYGNLSCGRELNASSFFGMRNPRWPDKDNQLCWHLEKVQILASLRGATLLS